MIDGMNCCLILCSYPHHESRVGELYNAVVPAFDEDVCAEASQVQEDRFLKCSVVFFSLWIDTSYIPSDDAEDIVDEYLEEAHKITNRSDDFLLQVLYEHDFNINSSIRCLRKEWFSFLSLISSVVSIWLLHSFFVLLFLIHVIVFVILVIWFVWFVNR